MEALKYLEPRELIQMELVSKKLRKYSASDEVWGEHIDKKLIRRMSFKENYRYQAQFLAYIDEGFLTITGFHTSAEESVGVTLSLKHLKKRAWVCLPFRVLCCGGKTKKTGKSATRRSGSSNHYSKSSFLININTMRCQRLSNMCKQRAQSGLVHCGNVVYLFGGKNRHGSMSSCEKYSLSTNIWVHLPNMSSPRRCFTPCLHDKKIFLAGGISSNHRIEIFDLYSDQFLPSPFSMPFSGNLAICVVLGEYLVVLGNGLMLLYNMQTGEEEARSATPYEDNWYSPGGLVTWEGKVYFGAWPHNRIYAIDDSLSIYRSNIA